MNINYLWLFTGIFIGWFTKFPLLLKWYRGLNKEKIQNRQIIDSLFRLLKSRKEAYDLLFNKLMDLTNKELEKQKQIERIKDSWIKIEK